jgi:radical SAM/Cys-rich protein
MERATVDLVLEFVRRQRLRRLDLTGGAPELNPHFRHLVAGASDEGVQVIDRCNLTVLEEPGQEDLGEFLAAHRVEVVASLPCYLQDNVDRQRGKGVFGASIAALRRLNALGYGEGARGLSLSLVYNPQGPVLPPAQAALEQDYRRHLMERYGIRFNRLLTLINMPIKRFGSSLLSKGQFDEYLRLLKDSYCPDNLNVVMCRSLVSVDWKGYLYDCDFNQMLGLTLNDRDRVGRHLSDWLDRDLAGREISVADHCYGCTAGHGSSCGGALS